MPFIIPANSAVSGGFDVDNSCRFDGSSSYLYKTPANAGNRLKYTFSTWVKKSKITGEQIIFTAYASNTNHTYLRFKNTGEIRYRDVASDSTNGQLVTSAKFRDPSAWLHVVLVVDEENGTSGNRLILYVNGLRVTQFSTETMPTAATTWNSANVKMEIGVTDGGDGDDWFDGYMAETVFIDGSALAPTDFGEFDEDSGIWKPIKVSGLTFGTNGFYLDFKEASNLGNDANGGTDFTEVGLAAVDQSTDTCTNNFATINSLDNYYAQATFSNGNLTVVTPVSQYAYIRSTIAASSGKWYAEMKITTASAADNQHGIVSDAAINSTGGVGERANAYGYRGSGQVVSGGSVVSYSAASYTAGDIISIAMDLDNNLIFFYKNGAIQNSGTGLAITAPASTTDGVYYFATSDNANLGGGTYQFDWNFGSPPFAISSGNQDGDGFGNFEYAVPSGYFALNTKNLAEYG